MTPIVLCAAAARTTYCTNMINESLPTARDLRSFEIRFEFESAVPIRKWWADSKFSNRPCLYPLLVVVKRLKPLTALSGTVYKLTSSMSDHTPVLFNMSEKWNEKFVVLHVSFVSFVINYW